MSTLTSASTYAQIQAAYRDNASYAEDHSVAKAKAFVTACRFLLLELPRSAGTPQAETTTAIDLIQKEKTAAEEWLGANDVDTGAGASARGPSTSVASFRNFR